MHLFSVMKIALNEPFVCTVLLDGTSFHEIEVIPLHLLHGAEVSFTSQPVGKMISLSSSTWTGGQNTAV